LLGRKLREQPRGRRANAGPDFEDAQRAPPRRPLAERPDGLARDGVAVAEALLVETLGDLRLALAEEELRGVDAARQHLGQVLAAGLEVAERLVDLRAGDLRLDLGPERRGRL